MPNISNTDYLRLLKYRKVKYAGFLTKRSPFKLSKIETQLIDTIRHREHENGMFDQTLQRLKDTDPEFSLNL